MHPFYFLNLIVIEEYYWINWHLTLLDVQVRLESDRIKPDMWFYL